MNYRIFTACALLALASCGGPSRRTAPAETTRPRVFLPPIAPVALPDEEKRAYLRDRYWDRFDFGDTLFVREADTLRMVEAFARFVALISDAPTDAGPMRRLMAQASASRPMLDYFAFLASEVLHDPNSPLRNDEFYIPVLEAQLSSPFYDEYERMGPEHELRTAGQNRLGRRANDLRYTLASGATHRLYDLKSDYVLLFINNPGCPMCRDIREAIDSSPLLHRFIDDGRLRVLALYPDEDLGEWHRYRSEIPARWINAYDRGCVLRETESYDLSAIPSLYLLDRDKRVLAKDATDVALIEELLLRDEAL